MIDLKKIKTIYKIGKGLKMQDVQAIINAAHSKKFAPTEYLMRAGTLKREVFYIKKGLVRVYTINNKGDEITTNLRWENYIIASPELILENTPSKYYYQALEPTEVLYMDYDVLQDIVDSNPKLEQNRKFIFQKMLKDALNRIELFVLYSPEERYIHYVATNPDIVNRVPDKYLANVLGITPVSLSRIRKRIASKKKI